MFKKLYNSIIKKAKKENRNKHKGVYYEQHHIIPRCLNGDNNQDNLVLLTTREHLVCHFLLTKIYPKNDALLFALQAMSMNNGKRIPFRLYGVLKERHAEIMSLRGKERVGDKNTFYGKKHTDDFKQKLSDERKNKWTLGKENGMYGKTFYDVWVEKYGIEDADARLNEYRKNMSSVCMGEKNGFYGKTHNEETRKILSEQKKKTYILKNPKGEVFERKGINEIANEFSLHAKTLIRFLGKGKIPKPKWKNQPLEKYNTEHWEIKEKL